MRKFLSVLLCICILSLSVFCLTGAVTDPQKKTIELSSENISYELSNKLYGVYLEDISYALDGGLVSNLVSNNSFEPKHNPADSWQIDAENWGILKEQGLNTNNPNYLMVQVKEKATVKNLGFREIYDYKSYEYDEKKAETPDMGFKANEKYIFTAYFKNIDFAGVARAKLQARGNDEVYEFDISNCAEWTKISVELTSQSTADGALLLEFIGYGTFYMDYATLVPENSYGYGADEWKYTTLRTDLVEAIKCLSPQFIRFSLGSVTESNKLEYFHSWKDTIGALEQRVQTENIWVNSQNNGRFYNSSNAMGFHEYFTLCDDLGAEPIPVLNAGIVIQNRAAYNEQLQKYNNGEMTEAEWLEYVEDIALTPETDAFKAYLQDIFDLIEYANGDVTTTWGAKRAENGHSGRFNVRYIAIGNENWGEVYWRNFDAIYKAVKAKYPYMNIVASTGNSGAGEEFDSAWQQVNANYRDVIVDEHYYTKDGYLFGTTDRYDSYERSGAKVMVGEYSAKSNGVGTMQTKSNIWAGVENAAYLTGVERNSDVVEMISYAPLLAKNNAQFRSPNLIWFDSQKVVLNPDYYTQMLFANNYGTNYLNTNFDETENGIYQCSTVDTVNHVIYVKLVNTNNVAYNFDIKLTGFTNVKKPTVQYMTENFKGACNEFTEELHITPEEMTLEVKDNTISYNAGSYSIGVIRIPYGKNNGNGVYNLPDYDVTTPYLPPIVWIVVSSVMAIGVVLTGIVILIVRIAHHRDLKKKEEA